METGHGALVALIDQVFLGFYVVVKARLRQTELIRYVGQRR